MKISIFAQTLENLLKCSIMFTHSFGRVWSIGGWGDKYIDPDYITIDSLFSLVEHLDRCSVVTEKGVIRGHLIATTRLTDFILPLGNMILTKDIFSPLVSCAIRDLKSQKGLNYD